MIYMKKLGADTALLTTDLWTLARDARSLDPPRTWDGALVVSRRLSARYCVSDSVGPEQFGTEEKQAELRKPRNSAPDANRVG
jgi:hypothetical protein